MQGDPGYVKFMKAVELNPDRFNFPSIKSAMQELQEKPRIVFVTELSRIEYFYKQNYNFPGFKVIKGKKNSKYGIYFSKIFTIEAFILSIWSSIIKF